MAQERLGKLLEMERLKPHDAFIRFAIAQEYVNAQKDELALPYFTTLAKEHSTYVPLYYHLGKLYERQGLLHEARLVYAAGITEARKAHDLKTAGELQEALTLLEDE
jgi:predicted Zn-dependent protease